MMIVKMVNDDGDDDHDDDPDDHDDRNDDMKNYDDEFMIIHHLHCHQVI